MLIIIGYGGVGSPTTLNRCVKQAVVKAVLAWKQIHSVLRAAVTGVVALEDDPHFNAGTGSYLRLDGKTIEMDAAVMDSEGHFGAVAAIQKVKNPVKVAYALLDTPYTVLCGQGATEFARRHCFVPYDPITPRARRVFRKRLKQLKNNQLPAWAKKWRNLSLKQETDGYQTGPVCRGFGTGRCDTVGIVVTDGIHFAAASSTGGVSLALPGRVGDTPLIGCGLYAGPKGAVTATGIGEEITKRLLSREVYEKIASGWTAQKASEWGVKLFPKDIPIGVIAVSRNNYGIAANQSMANAHLKQM